MKQHLDHLLRSAMLEIKADFTGPIVLERPRDPKHGDYSSSIALMQAKAMQLPPKVLAEKMMALIKKDERIAEISIAGPGFINFSLSMTYIHHELDQLWASPLRERSKLEVKPRVVIDYSSPNLAKEMHVGHLRSSIIGDALARILEFQGCEVIRQNHIGDWGTQFGMLIAHMQSLPKTNQEIALVDLEGFYQAAKQRFDAEPEFADEARAWVVKLQAHEAEALGLWQEFIRLSLAHCQTLYQRLGLSLTSKDLHAESAYNEMLPQIIQKLDDKGLLSDQGGTLCVFMDEFKAKDGSPLPVIVRKKDGAYLYASTDLAALDYRQSVLHAHRILYVVDARQSLHFQQIFALARRAGFVDADTQLEHIEFGMILDKAGRPFKSRDGGVTKLKDLLDEAEQRAFQLIKEKNPERPDLESRRMAAVIGIAAVKYADLSKNRISDYVFDWDSMISFEGNTAPYLLYANTRIHSLFAKAQQSMTELPQAFDLKEPAEIAVAKHLLQFSVCIAEVAAKATPHLLCTYLYELASLFSSFYESCPILTATESSLRQSRLKLAALSSRILEQGFELLGINSLKQM